MKERKRKKRLIILGVLVLCAGLAVLAMFSMGILGGVSEKLPALEAVQPLPVGEEIPFNAKDEEFRQVAEVNGNKLFMRPSDANFYVETAAGTQWYANPLDARDDSWATRVYKLELASSLIISYYDLEDKQENKKNSETVCVKKKAITMYQLENGFRTDYYFKDGDVTIPVEVTLEDDYLKVRVVTSEIKEESPDECLLSNIRLLPNFGGGGANDEGYVLLPDGQGALMYFNNGEGNSLEYRSSVYGDNKTTTLVFRPSDGYKASLPVYGVKKNDTAFLSIITGGDEYASLNALANQRNSSYCGVYADYKMRYTDRYMLDISSFNAQTITLYQDQGFEMPALEQRYYFLEGDQANLAGMADVYRQYLIQEKGMEEKKNDDTVLFLDYYAGVSRKESTLGVPVLKQKQLSGLTDIQKMYQALREKADGGINLRVQSWSQDALKGQIDTSLSWAAGNNWKDWEALQGAVKSAGDEIALTVEPVKFTDQGNGIIPVRDSAKSLSRSPAFQYTFSVGTRMEDGSAKRGYLLHPALIGNVTEQMTGALEKQQVTALSPLSIPSMIYGSYDTNVSYPMQTVAAIEAALQEMGQKYSLFMDNPNAYALPYADFLVNVPGGSSSFDLLDVTVPFVQMVYGDLVGYAGEAINLQADPQAAMLEAIATGGALNYALVTGDTELLIDTQLNYLYSVRADLWQNPILEALAQVEAARKLTENSRLVGFEWIGDHASVSEFENGAVICVNYGKDAITWEGVEVAPKTWQARGEGTK
ncbi:MAG: hypothetical protein E7324_04365 [Clostridiales bacterium]|nr:hypothetical protein [Clostridiales bacterium]